MQQSDKEKSKKVIRLWKSGKVYPEEFLNSIEQIMDRAGVPTNNEDVNMVNKIRLKLYKYIEKILSRPQ